MISAAQIKLVRSLRQKKYRDQSHLYTVEGEKMVQELLMESDKSDHRPVRLFATHDYLHRNKEFLSGYHLEIIEASRKELEKVSNLVTPQPVVALVSKPDPISVEEIPSGNPVLAFDAIRDPGNLGTILRTADWFGIRHLVCSTDSADLYNPKVVQSTMGALFRVEVIFTELQEWLAKIGTGQRQILGTYLEGDNIYQVPFAKNPVILFGNESKGLPDHFEAFLTKKISIPSFHRNGPGPESLNVASSVAVICSELRRRTESVSTQNEN